MRCLCRRGRDVDGVAQNRWANLMSDTENLGPEYQHEKNRLSGRKLVWSRKKSSPWTLTLAVIGTLLVVSGIIVATFLLGSHPGKPEPNAGITEQTTPPAP